MMVQDVMILLQEITLQAAPKQPEECYLNPPCGCSNPGKELQCEACPDLEACLSRCKALKKEITNNVR